MEANELRFHKNIIKSPILASKHQNRILSISKNKIEKIMNRVHTWKASSHMEAHLTSSPIFMTPPERRPDQDLFSKGYSSNSPPLLSFFPLVPSSLFFFLLFFVSLFFSSKLLFSSHSFLWCSLVNKHGLPNHSLLLHACCSRHQALSFLAASPIWPGFMVREGGSPSHFFRITRLHSNSPKALLNPPTGVSTLLHFQPTTWFTNHPTRKQHLAL